MVSTEVLVRTVRSTLNANQVLSAEADETEAAWRRVSAWPVAWEVIRSLFAISKSSKFSQNQKKSWSAVLFQVAEAVSSPSNQSKYHHGSFNLRHRGKEKRFHRSSRRILRSIVECRLGSPGCDIFDVEQAQKRCA